MVDGLGGVVGDEGVGEGFFEGLVVGGWKFLGKVEDSGCDARDSFGEEFGFVGV